MPTSAQTLRAASLLIAPDLGGGGVLLLPGEGDELGKDRLLNAEVYGYSLPIMSTDTPARAAGPRGLGEHLL